MVVDLFWLSDKAWTALVPLVPTNQLGTGVQTTGARSAASRLCSDLALSDAAHHTPELAGKRPIALAVATMGHCRCLIRLVQLLGRVTPCRLQVGPTTSSQFDFCDAGMTGRPAIS